MAKEKKVNKTHSVKEYLKAHPGTSNKDVAEALTKQGIKLTPGHVANIKAKSRKRRRAATAVVAKSGVGIPQIKLAMALLKACSGFAEAKAALSAAQEIRAIM